MGGLHWDFYIFLADVHETVLFFNLTLCTCTEFNPTRTVQIIISVFVLKLFQFFEFQCRRKIHWVSVNSFSSCTYHFLSIFYIFQAKNHDYKGQSKQMFPSNKENQHFSVLWHHFCQFVPILVDIVPSYLSVDTDKYAETMWTQINGPQADCVWCSLGNWRVRGFDFAWWIVTLSSCSEEKRKNTAKLSRCI